MGRRENRRPEVEVREARTRVLDDGEKADYFQRCYTSADGLWFMMVEEMWGFEEALEIDRQVWSVLPKIQARTLREMLGVGKGIGGLAECIAAKHSAEGFGFEMEAEEGGRLRLTISRCPWQDLMARSGRAHLSDRVGSIICNAEYSAWAAEFSEEDRKISFLLKSRICGGDDVCTFSFEG
ncbi:MAG: hypothetical protein METHAR1v1_90002 [Methanothrix sp.]|jgi:hypothetical protein|nr:MAG: hypothetical protein METHAR1v1_90002 [Methanothrix sp.]